MSIVYHDGEPGKVCSKCGEWRPLARYRKRLLSRDGYDYVCRECSNEKSREWRAQHKQRVQELNREFYEANREERLEYHRQYRQNNQGRIKQLLAKFRHEHPDYHRDYMRRWTKASPDKVRARDNARRVFKMGQPASFTANEWSKLKERYNYTCLRCGRREPEIKLTADHVVPISKGGIGTIDNIQPLCRHCNTAKSDTTVDYRPNWE